MGKEYVFISCSKQKAQTQPGEPDLVVKVYISIYFKLCLKYALKNYPDAQILILSDKYYVLRLNDKIETYELSLESMGAHGRQQWAKEVLLRLKDQGCDFENDEFVFLTGMQYYENLIGDGKIRHYETPFSGLKGIGYIMQFLKNSLK